MRSTSNGPSNPDDPGRFTGTRTEDDIRAAFQLAAQDAPASERLLARVHARPPRRPRFGTPLSGQFRFGTLLSGRFRFGTLLPVAASIVVVLAVVGLVVGLASSGSNKATSSSGAAGSLTGAQGQAPQANSGSSAAGSAGGGYGAGGQGSAAAGSTGAQTQPVQPSGPSPSNLCTPAQLHLSLVWTSSGSSLHGTLTATSIAQTACDLLVRPSVTPVNSSGSPVDVPNINSTEGRVGPQLLVPGASATSQIVWSQWCGADFGATAQVNWGTGAATATVTRQAVHAVPCPASGPTAMIMSGWFSPLA